MQAGDMSDQIQMSRVLYTETRNKVHVPAMTVLRRWQRLLRSVLLPKPLHATADYTALVSLKEYSGRSPSLERGTEHLPVLC